MTAPGLRARMIRGAQAQVVGHVVRVIVQVGGVSVLTAAWGLNLYGEWLILAAIPTYLTLSDIGLFSAASNEMIMLVGRNDRPAALAVFQSVSSMVTLLFALLLVVVPLVAIAAPLADWFHLSVITETSASWVLTILGINTLVMCYAGVLFGGFAAEGRYGEAGFAVAAVTLAEFLGLAGTVVIGGGPVLAALAMLSARSVGTVAMYVWMRHYAPWLHLGKPPGVRRVLRPLISPALASAAFPAAFALNVQGMVVLVGAVLGPAAAAVFSILRTMSRVVIQLLASVFSVVAPEISKAYAAGDVALLRTLHRRGCQAAIWLAMPLLLVLALFGGPIIDIWTAGEVDPHGALLYLFLAVAGLDSLWYTSLAVMFATNRHQRLATYYVIASALNLPLAYLMLKVWGVDGAAATLVLLELFMLVAVLHQALPAAGDTLRGWIDAVARPPLPLLRPSATQARG